MDVADRELERMVERRSRNRETDPDERDEPWKESVRAYNARREEVRSARVEYHRGQAIRLRAAQDSGEATNCPECGRQLTFGEGEGPS
jgi:hypothetical protein